MTTNLGGPQTGWIEMSATRFALAYLDWLKRPGRMLREPGEPRPDQHGLAPERDSEGRIIGENALAEPLRRHVHQLWEGHVLETTLARKAMKEGS